MAAVIHASLFGTTSNSAKFKQMGLSEVKFCRTQKHGKICFFNQMGSLYFILVNFTALRFFCVPKRGRKNPKWAFSLELFVLIKFRYCCFVTVQLMQKTCSINKKCLSFSLRFSLPTRCKFIVLIFKINFPLISRTRESISSLFSKI